MMRVLHLIGSLAAGGIESFLLNTYRSIDREKIQFDFVIASKAGWVQSYADEIQRLGGRIYLIPTFSLKRFSSFLKEHPEYSIIHCHRGAMSALFLRIAKMHGVKERIVHSHSSSDSLIKKTIYFFLKKRLSKVATHFIACGEDAGKYLFGNKQYQIIYNGIDVNRFVYDSAVDEEVRKELGIDENVNVYGHIGRFEYPKNHLLLIDIFSEISRMETDAKFLMIGDGSMKQEIEDRSKEKGIYDRCIFTGNRNDVDRLLKCIDCVIFPSHYEGFSVAMIEMQAASVPILASTRVPKEVNITGLVDFLDLSEDVKGWAEHAIELSKINIKKNRGNQIIEAGLDSKSVAKRIELLYLSLNLPA